MCSVCDYVREKEEKEGKRRESDGDDLIRNVSESEEKKRERGMKLKI